MSPSTKTFDRSQLKSAPMREYPILIGRTGDGYHEFHGGEHVALYARTGTGKSSSMTIPNCFSWRGSLVVLDIKGQAFRATAGYRSRVLGQDVYVFNPTAENGRSHRWTPLQAVRRDGVDRFDQISRQAFMLFPEASGTSTTNADAFWTPSARSAFTAVSLLLAETPDLPFTMDGVLRSFTRGDSFDVLAGMIERRRASKGPGYSQAAVDGISDYINGSNDQVGGIRKMTSTRLQSWFNPRIAAATAASDFDLRDVRRKPMTVYVTVEPGNIPRLRPLLTLFFDSLVNLNSDKTPEEDPSIRHQVLVILDEFIRLGRQETVADSGQYIRGYGFRLLYILQNTAQLRAKYGPDAAKDILDNIGAEIVFGTNDLELTKELSERMGDDTVGVTTRNRPRFWPWLNPSRQSEAEHPHRRPLMLPQEVARLDPSEQIILRAGMLPMRTGRCRWFDDPHFTTLVREPPEVPPLDIVVPVDDGKTKVLAASQKKLPAITAADVKPEMEDADVE